MKAGLAFLAGAATVYGLLVLLMWPRDHDDWGDGDAPRLRAVS